MPLINSEAPPATNETHYVVFFASGEPSWCPDCRDALPALNAVFGGSDAPAAHVVRVGDRTEWRTPRNTYRQAPWKISGVPTVIKYVEGREIGRLGDVESQSESALKNLVNQ